MKTLVRIEELAIVIGSYYIALYLGIDWWIYPAVFFLPDLSMLGYLFNPKVGAWVYNLFHHRAIAVLLGLVGVLTHESFLQFSAMLLMGHISLDRLLGYGLKYSNSFQNTHLGWIGKKLC